MYRTNACFGISLNCLPMQRRGKSDSYKRFSRNGARERQW
ncbi:coatomer subunit beta [Trichinella spiralis]|nr:coatomer subunit beta [Trichinella spiralis]